MFTAEALCAHSLQGTQSVSIYLLNASNGNVRDLKKKRLGLCSSAVYGNAGLCVWIIHVSFQTEKFGKTDKVKGFFLFSRIIWLWFRFDQSLISAAQRFKTYSPFVGSLWRSVTLLEDQQLSVKWVFTCLTRMKSASEVFFMMTDPHGVFSLQLFNYTLCVQSPALRWDSKHWRAGSF